MFAVAQRTRLDESIMTRRGSGATSWLGRRSWVASPPQPGCVAARSPLRHRADTPARLRRKQMQRSRSFRPTLSTPPSTRRRDRDARWVGNRRVRLSGVNIDVVLRRCVQLVSERAWTKALCRFASPPEPRRVAARSHSPTARTRGSVSVASSSSHLGVGPRSHLSANADAREGLRRKRMRQWPPFRPTATTYEW
jgi:hypothetical protein